MFYGVYLVLSASSKRCRFLLCCLYALHFRLWTCHKSIFHSVCCVQNVYAHVLRMWAQMVLHNTSTHTHIVWSAGCILWPFIGRIIVGFRFGNIRIGSCRASHPVEICFFFFASLLLLRNVYGYGSVCVQCSDHAMGPIFPYHRFICSCIVAITTQILLTYT